MHDVMLGRDGQMQVEENDVLITDNHGVADSSGETFFWTFKLD